MFHVDFLNKNTFRNYPIRGTASAIGQDGIQLPTALLCSAQFTVTSSYSDVFIARILVNATYLNILVGAYIGGVLCHLGVFSENITADYQRMGLTPLIAGVYGMVVVGRQDTLNEYQGTHEFTYSTAPIEDSLVTCVPSPAVSSIFHNGIGLTGDIVFQYNNIKRDLTNTSSIELAVINKESVRAVNDTSPQLGNCPNTPIGSMNGVEPDDNGNIDIYGIYPVKITIEAGRLGLSVPSLTRTELCAEEKRIPPSKNSSAYGDIKTVAKPEWKSWAQYQEAP